MVIRTLLKQQMDSSYCPFYCLQFMEEIDTRSRLIKVAHPAQIDNEAVPLVEAGPGQAHLCGPDGPATLDVQQALHVHVIGHHMLKSRSHAPFL